MSRPTPTEPNRTIRRWEAGIAEVAGRVRGNDQQVNFNSYANIFYSIYTFSHGDVRRVWPAANNTCGATDVGGNPLGGP